MASSSPPSADLAGRAVRLSVDVPTCFDDAPLAPHHKLVGRWALDRIGSTPPCTRMDARRQIERVFAAAVQEILAPFTLADLRVVALAGGGDLAPALAVFCETVGQIELNWIEKSNALRETLRGSVAPTDWQAAAYSALTQALPAVLPIFGYDDLFEEMSAYYWDGETDDESARRSLVEYQGHSLEDIEAMTLPSEMNAQRPRWMLAEAAAPLKDLPKGLAGRIRKLRSAHAAFKAVDRDEGAWCCLSAPLFEYVPGHEDSSTLPPMTLVPFEHFARELDDIGRIGMEAGFATCAGLLPLGDAGRIDGWFASLRLGADVLIAAQDLILTDPTKERSR